MSEPHSERETSASEIEACRYIIRLVYERCGLRLHPEKKAFIKARLGKRLRHFGMLTLSEYCDLLRRSGAGTEEAQVVEALTTSFTSFLREEEHFTFMVEEALPSLISRHKRNFQAWSAACSSGEEPYTIGLYLSEHYPSLAGWDWSITASDISAKVLDQAKLGIYPAERLTALPRGWLQKYFQKGIGRWRGQFRIKSGVAERIAFSQINLVADYSHARPFEIIFCRNVMIYFDRVTQEKLLRQLCRFLVPGGYLLIGHSENITGLDVPLQCLRPSIYQKEAP